MSNPKHGVAGGSEGGIHLALDRPAHGPETANGTTAGAVAPHVAPGSAVRGGLAPGWRAVRLRMCPLLEGANSSFELRLGSYSLTSGGDNYSTRNFGRPRTETAGSAGSMAGNRRPWARKLSPATSVSIAGAEWLPGPLEASLPVGAGNKMGVATT